MAVVFFILLFWGLCFKSIFEKKTPLLYSPTSPPTASPAPPPKKETPANAFSHSSAESASRSCSSFDLLKLLCSHPHHSQICAFPFQPPPNRWVGLVWEFELTRGKREADYLGVSFFKGPQQNDWLPFCFPLKQQNNMWVCLFLSWCPFWIGVERDAKGKAPIFGAPSTKRQTHVFLLLFSIACHCSYLFLFVLLLPVNKCDVQCRQNFSGFGPEHLGCAHTHTLTHSHTHQRP